MQNCYVGDIGDFGKYGLLKALGGDDLRLGVVWYLNPDEKKRPEQERLTGDGSLMRYLPNDKWRLRECHPDERDLRSARMRILITLMWAAIYR